MNIKDKKICPHGTFIFPGGNRRQINKIIMSYSDECFGGR
jgi:hypothetical protein